MQEEPHLKEIQKQWHGTLNAYLIGFFGSLILTGASFFLVWMRIFEKPVLILTIIGLAIMQAAVQLFFFLHIGEEAHPKWETLIFSFMVLVLIIVVSGTLWIMFDLNHRVMPFMSGFHHKG